MVLAVLTLPFVVLLVVLAHLLFGHRPRDAPHAHAAAG
jgi:hypothetical protein